VGSWEQARETDFSTVRTRAKAKDMFEGATGHDYIVARQLNRSVQRVQTSAHQTPQQSEGK
jgi:hypothetical protein